MVSHEGRLYSSSLPLVYFVVRIYRNITLVRFAIATRSASGTIEYRLSRNSSV